MKQMWQIDKALTSYYSLQAIMETPAQVFCLLITACMQSVSVCVCVYTNDMTMDFAHSVLKLNTRYKMECWKELSLVGVVPQLLCIQPWL